MPGNVTLESCPLGRSYQVRAIIRPANLDDRAWRLSLSRIEELGLFPGQIVEKLGSIGRGNTVTIRVGGSRVAISGEIASVIMIRANA